MFSDEGLASLIQERKHPFTKVAVVVIEMKFRKGLNILSVK